MRDLQGIRAGTLREVERVAKLEARWTTVDHVQRSTSRPTSLLTVDCRLSSAMSCLFCKIISREIPGSIVYEDDHVLAFNDINPQAPTHVLVIPKRHIESLNDLQPGDDQIVGELARRAAAIAKERGHLRGRVPDGVQYQPRRRPDGVSHPSAPARRPQHGLAPGLDASDA